MSNDKVKSIFRFILKVFICFIFLFAIIVFVVINYDHSLVSSMEAIREKEDYYVNPYYSKDLEITMVDVGQGDGFVFTIDDKVVVVDCGPMHNYTKMTDYLESIGCKEINLLILTHPHQDHFGGLSSILSTFRVDKIYTTRITSKVHKSFLEKMQLIYYNHIIGLFNKVNNYDRVKSIYYKDSTLKKISVTDDLQIRFLSPEKAWPESINNNSIVFLLSYKDVRALFTGDIEIEQEERLINEYESELRNLDILKISHHGSYTSSSIRFLKVTHPEIVLLSCGFGNQYKHPHMSSITRLEIMSGKIYRTDETGTISLVIKNSDDIEANTVEGDYASGETVKKTGKASSLGRTSRNYD